MNQYELGVIDHLLRVVEQASAEEKPAKRNNPNGPTIITLAPGDIPALAYYVRRLLDEQGYKPPTP